MKYIRYLIIVVLVCILSGCSTTNIFSTDNRELLSDDAFEFLGTWEITSYENINEKIDLEKNNDVNILENKVQIGKSSINIFNKIIKNVRYKLKVVDSSYIISYENNLTAGSFIKDDEKLDIISVIDDNLILCELVILDKNNIVLIYKSTLIYLTKLSNEVSIDNNIIGYSGEISVDDRKDDSEGIMLGIKTPRKKNEDGTYTEEKYRTIWIAYKNNEVTSIYEKDNIIFPRMNGIWELKLKSQIKDSRIKDYFEISSLDGKVVSKIENYSNENTYNINTNYENSNIYKSIEFIGNDYIAIQKYIGNEFINEYPIYQIIPVDNINSSNGLSIEEIFSKDIKEKYTSEFKETYNNIQEDEVANYSNIVDYTNIKMDRKDGRWILKGKIKSIKENESGKDFELSIEPNKKLINFNSLVVPWKILKGEIPFMEDSITSPSGEVAIIRYKKTLGIYKLEEGHLTGPPLDSIKIRKNEEIIMTEWCSSSYVEQWEKAFIDGRNLIQEEE